MEKNLAQKQIDEIVIKPDNFKNLQRKSIPKLDLNAKNLSSIRECN